MSSSFDSHPTKQADKSSVWFNFLICTNDESAKCKKCGQIIKAKGGSTSGLHTHLKKHNVKLSREAPTQLDVVKRKVPKISEFLAPQDTISAVLARLVAMDGIPFSVVVKSLEIKKSLIARKLKVVNSSNTAKKYVIQYYKENRSEMQQELSTYKKQNNKFSVSFDEWTSLSNKRFINIVLHGENVNWNLGLVRIKGAANAENCIKMFEDRLSDFDIDLSADVVSLTTDGAHTMVKVGRLINAHHQLCFAHGIQLGIVDVLYKKRPLNHTNSANFVEDDDDNTADDEDNEEEIGEPIDCVQNFQHDEVSDLVEEYDLHKIIDKVRKTVRAFRKSPKQNEILQNYVFMELGKNLSLIIDCKTRWNSLLKMLERFLLFGSALKKAAVDLNTDCLEDFLLHIIKQLVKVLKPAELAIEALCRQHMSLCSANAAIEFMLSEINDIDSPLANEIALSIKFRVNERTTIYTSVLKVLTTGSFENVKNNETEIKNELLNILQRLDVVKEDKENVNGNSSEDIELIEGELNVNTPKKNSLKKKLEEALVASTKIKKKPQVLSLKNTISKEIALFLNNGKRGSNIEKAFKFLKTIPPTSVECERCFSSSGRICNKVRSSLNDETLNALVFLKAYFLKELK